MPYQGTHSGLQVDEGLNRALNPATTLGTSETALVSQKLLTDSLSSVGTVDKLPDYDSTKEYVLDESFVYNDKIYRTVIAHEAEEFNTEHNEMLSGDSINIVQTTGQSETDVMSQKAVTDNILEPDNTTIDKRSSDNKLEIKSITQNNTTSTSDLTFGGTFTSESKTVNSKGQVTGTNTKTLKVPSLPIIFGEPIFYVDSVNGSDSNNGTSEATSWRTLSKAINYTRNLIKDSSCVRIKLNSNGVFSATSEELSNLINYELFSATDSSDNYPVLNLENNLYIHHSKINFEKLKINTSSNDSGINAYDSKIIFKTSLFATRGITGMNDWSYNLIGTACEFICINTKFTTEYSGTTGRPRYNIAGFEATIIRDSRCIYDYARVKAIYNSDNSFYFRSDAQTGNSPLGVTNTKNTVGYYFA